MWRTYSLADIRMSSSILLFSFGLGNDTSSYAVSLYSSLLRVECEHTSKLCAYHSLTFSMLGILLSPSGRLSSSTTRWDNRMGSSSERN